MLSKLLLLLTLGLIGTKLWYPSKWHKLRQGLDRLVNALLIAIGLVYSAQIVMWFAGWR